MFSTALCCVSSIVPNSVLLCASPFRSDVVIFLPPKLHSKLEDSTITFKGKPAGLETFIKENFSGMVGVLTDDNQAFFTRRPFVVAYFDLDYVKNPKGKSAVYLQLNIAEKRVAGCLDICFVDPPLLREGWLLKSYSTQSYSCLMFMNFC